MSENNISFSRIAMRALVLLSKEDRIRVHKWIDDVSVAVKGGQMPKDSIRGEEGSDDENNVTAKITSYDDPLFGVDIDNQVHLVCAITEKNCSVLMLNMADNLDL